MSLLHGETDWVMILSNTLVVLTVISHARQQGPKHMKQSRFVCKWYCGMGQCH
jgi:hypothetical protein